MHFKSIIFGIYEYTIYNQPQTHMTYVNTLFYALQCIQMKNIRSLIKENHPHSSALLNCYGWVKCRDQLLCMYVKSMNNYHTNIK